MVIQQNIIILFIGIIIMRRSKMMDKCPKCGRYTLDSDNWNLDKKTCLNIDCNYTNFKKSNAHIPKYIREKKVEL